MVKRSLFVLGVSAMLAMPLLASGQRAPSTPGTGSGPEVGGSGSSPRMEQPGQRGQAEVHSGDVRQAQERLKDAGFNPGPMDGQLGAQTKEALREYQKAHGLPQTGQLDELTREFLMAQKPREAPGRTQTPGGSMREETRPGESMPGSRSPGGSGPGSSPPGGSSSGR
jgi:peptidoglycan hydrolase-like protein with peptidoglycan-binding domain